MLTYITVQRLPLHGLGRFICSHLFHLLLKRHDQVTMRMDLSTMATRAADSHSPSDPSLSFSLLLFLSGRKEGAFGRHPSLLFSSPAASSVAPPLGTYRIQTWSTPFRSPAASIMYVWRRMGESPYALTYCLLCLKVQFLQSLLLCLFFLPLYQLRGNLP